MDITKKIKLLPYKNTLTDIEFGTWSFISLIKHEYSDINVVEVLRIFCI